MPSKEECQGMLTLISYGSLRIDGIVCIAVWLKAEEQK